MILNFSLDLLRDVREAGFHLAYRRFPRDAATLESIKLLVQRIEVLVDVADDTLCDLQKRGSSLRLEGRELGSEFRKSCALVDLFQGSHCRRGELQLLLVTVEVDRSRGFVVLCYIGLIQTTKN